VTIELSAKIIGSTSGNLTNSVKATGETAGGVVVSKEASAVVSSLLVVGPNDSISKAIELARPGDVVEVESGTYHDCIVLNKNITLKGVDTGGGPPVIAGDGVESTITMMADGCAIEGFEVTGSGNPHAGIEILSNNNSVSKNVIRGNRGYGVRIFEAQGNSVTSNEIRENGFDGLRWRPKRPAV
jgi:nitrous oxidase accessory protein